jgi:hypothetical protein
MTIEPYYMTNKDWYYIDDKGVHHLTENAPKKAKESFEEEIEFYKTHADSMTLY